MNDKNFLKKKIARKSSRLENDSAASGFQSCKVQVVNHLFKVESSNVVAAEVNCDLICISFPLVIRNNNVLIQNAYSSRSRHSHARVIHAGLDWPTMVPVAGCLTDRTGLCVCVCAGQRAPGVGCVLTNF